MGLKAVGSEPSVVYRTTATPVSESTDERLTLTGAAVYQPLEHVALLQAIEDVGGAWSATDGGGCSGPPMTSRTVFTTVPFALLGWSQSTNAWRLLCVMA
jgi:hypothetical protein